MIRNIEKILKDKEYLIIIADLINQEKVQEMKQYRQHHKINCFEHCLFVSYNTYLICKKHHLDYISAARAGMLHDLFLYDWRKRENGRKGLHAFTHGRTAYEQASTFLKLNDKEKEIILLRYYKQKTQMQVSKILGITQVQVSRIERKVLDKMKKRLSG